MVKNVVRNFVVWEHDTETDKYRMLKAWTTTEAPKPPKPKKVKKIKVQATIQDLGTVEL